LAELIRKLDLAPAHLVGASYGAFIAPYCALKNPEIVNTMVLGEPPIAEFLARTDQKDDIELLHWFRTHVQSPTEDAFKGGDFKKAVQVAIDGIMEIENFFDQLPEEGKQSLMDNAETIESELQSSMSISFTIEDVKQITTVPTLLVKSELRPKFFLRISDILSDNMSNSEQIVIPNVGHDDFKFSNNFSLKVMQFFERHD
jgi:non-heme chloroperoxidase